MIRKRNGKIITMVALVVAIIGMSIGFAAFSATLNISSSASVTPNSSDFNLSFSTTEYSVDTNSSTCKLMNAYSTNNSSAGIGCVKTNSISDMITNFTGPGQSSWFRVYVHNTGKYPAYLTGLNISNPSGSNTYKKCEASTSDSTKATDSLVAAACEDIHLIFYYNDTMYSFGERITNEVLAPGEVTYFDLHVSYASDGNRADGPFNVIFGDISLKYDTFDAAAPISFTIDGVTYYAERNMTWGEWYDSFFNSSDAYIESNYLCSSGSSNVFIGYLDDYITSNDYPISSGSSRPCR